MGFTFLVEAAEKGHRHSLNYVAKAFDTGIGLGTDK